ncbi:MAG: palindromic element RPE1 domain-containing protein [Holosporales bacterium]|nr:palindromic element RPE1 domain-containing protein [Holosporales bacterium]
MRCPPSALSKPSESDLMEGDTERRSAVYEEVHEHSSTGSTYQKTDYGGLGAGALYRLRPLEISDCPTRYEGRP